MALNSIFITLGNNTEKRYWMSVITKPQLIWSHNNYLFGLWKTSQKHFQKLDIEIANNGWFGGNCTEIRSQCEQTCNWIAFLCCLTGIGAAFFLFNDKNNHQKA